MAIGGISVAVRRELTLVAVKAPFESEVRRELLRHPMSLQNLQPMRQYSSTYGDPIDGVLHIRFDTHGPRGAIIRTVAGRPIRAVRGTARTGGSGVE